MKYKLPEGFKLIKVNNIYGYGEVNNIYGYGEFRIHDLEKDSTSELRTCIISALDFIDFFIKQRELIKNIILPEKMKIIDKGIEKGFFLFNDDLFIHNSFNTEELILKAKGKTRLDLQLDALNNGEELEIP